MSAGGRAFDDEAVNLAAGLFGKGHGQSGGGDDAQEQGPFELRRRAAAKILRVKTREVLLARESAFHIEAQGGGTALRQQIECAGNRARDAGAHQDVIDAGEHGTVKRGQCGKLDLFQVVDADQAVMAFFGQEHFDEIRDYGQFHQRPAAAALWASAARLERRLRGFAAGNKIVRKDASSHCGKGKVGEGATQVTGGVAELKSPTQDYSEGGSGNDTKLAEARYSTRQWPARYRNAHSALNDLWLRHGQKISREGLPGTPGALTEDQARTPGVACLLSAARRRRASDVRRTGGDQ